MCGIFGSLTKVDYVLSRKQLEKRNSIIKGLALAMEDRGNQSTGIAGINRKFYNIYKDTIPARKFVESAGLNQILKENYNILIGHTRLATVGDVSFKNAHPFQYGDIVGVHNGHVSNYYEADKDLDVDSQAIFYLLNKNNNDYKKTFPELYGSFAIAWIDVRKPDNLYLVVDGNPLYLLYINELKTYFFASENYPLQAVVGSHFNFGKQSTWTPDSSKVYTITTNLQIKKESVEFAKYYRGNDMANGYSGHYSHHGAGNSYEKTESDFEAEDERALNEQYGYGGDANPPYTIDKNGYEKRTGSPNPFKTAENQKDNLLIDNIKTIAYKDMCKIVENVESKGCDFCKKKIDLIEDEGVYWYSQEKTEFVVCIPCVDKTHLAFEHLAWIEPEDYSTILEEIDLIHESRKIHKETN